MKRKVQVAALGSPCLTVRTVSVDTELDCTGSELRSCVKVEVGVPNSPYGLGATLNLNPARTRAL